MKRKRSRRHGFTLIEVMLVLLILVILASLGVVTYSNIQKKALRNAARAQIGPIEHAVEQYQLEVRNYPQDLQSLIEPPADLPNPDRWQGPYLAKGLPLDPWDNEYRYELDAEAGTYKIWSAGPDRVDNTDDDITNYDRS